MHAPVWAARTWLRNPQASGHIDAFKRSYSKMHGHIASVRLDAVTEGYVRSMWGRCRPFAGKWKSDKLKNAKHDGRGWLHSKLGDPHSFKGLGPEDKKLLREASNMRFQVRRDGARAEGHACMLFVHVRTCNR